jgi:hypothetical protein
MFIMSRTLPCWLRRKVIIPTCLVCCSFSFKKVLSTSLRCSAWGPLRVREWRERERERETERGRERQRERERKRERERERKRERKGETERTRQRERARARARERISQAAIATEATNHALLLVFFHPLLAVDEGLQQLVLVAQQRGELVLLCRGVLVCETRRARANLHAHGKANQLLRELSVSGILHGVDIAVKPEAVVGREDGGLLVAQSVW